MASESFTTSDEEPLLCRHFLRNFLTQGWIGTLLSHNQDSIGFER
ncbi:hypothetical protein [Calothrix sp. NIES-2100]